MSIFAKLRRAKFVILEITNRRVWKKKKSLKKILNKTGPKIEL